MRDEKTPEPVKIIFVIGNKRNVEKVWDGRPLPIIREEVRLGESTHHVTKVSHDWERATIRISLI